VRVAIVIKTLSPGGAEELVVTQLAVAKRYGDINEFEVWLPIGTEDDYVPRIEAEGVPVIKLASGGWRQRLWPLLLFLRTLRTEVAVVHNHSPSTAPVTRLAVAVRRLTGTNVGHVYTEHAGWGTRHPLVRALSRLTVGIDDATFIVSKNAMATLPPRVSRQTEVLYHGVDREALLGESLERSEARSQLGLPSETADDEFVVGIVANLFENKNHALALRAAADVCGSHPRVRFIAIGEGECRASLEALLGELGLEDRFAFVGSLPGASKYFTAFDAVLLCSRNEGLPVVIMEAFAFGLPVVATDVGGLHEMVEDGVSGLLVPDDDTGALASALIQLISDEDLRSRLSAGAGRTSAKFDALATNRVTSAAYEA
jgi:glycosyltransferase involved in cell wall biosynthesis